jgi:hypothetical protein
MDINRYLPVLVSAAVTLIVFGAIGLLALNWSTSAGQRLWIRRALLVLVLVTVGGPVIYWFATWAVEGTQRHTIDRSLQQQQQDELHQRVHKGGH